MAGSENTRLVAGVVILVMIVSIVMAQPSQSPATAPSPSNPGTVAPSTPSTKAPSSSSSSQGSTPSSVTTTEAPSSTSTSPSPSPAMTPESGALPPSNAATFVSTASFAFASLVGVVLFF